MAGFNLAQKGRAGNAIIMRWTMTMMMMMTMVVARGVSLGRSINDSISLHKCKVTVVTLFTLSLFIIPIL